MGEFSFIFVLVIFFLIAASLRIVKQYEKGVIFRLGKVVGEKEPGLRMIIPVIDQMIKISMQIITMPVPSQKIITKDNVSIDVAAVAYYRVVNATSALVEIQNVDAAINQIAQTTVRNIVGQFMLDEVLSNTLKINQKVKEIIDTHTEVWGVMVNTVEIKDIQLPDTMQRAMAKQAEAEREKRAKIIAAEGEFQSADKLGQAADIIAAHPVALQLRNLQVLSEIAVEKNSTIVFPNTFLSTISDISKFFDGGK
ncbi:band 7 domain-containing protein [bacterium (Candidatus Howlettbacteria) CG_4_10_14_3_um_filter_37_10]|nr:MAG: band 7 domain-containing protein [bacterium (Candidatus Howlettbacteria) CG23_combo_of_CG06-09_8_20_14_all_37_9]PIY00478.1 MAG: band 7 domain-containing protein [bacterium (Candidatus Howlettbacteria) CG_4_10_14_3_um_filter_37_10]